MRRFVVIVFGVFHHLAQSGVSIAMLLRAGALDRSLEISAGKTGFLPRGLDEDISSLREHVFQPGGEVLHAGKFRHGVFGQAHHPCRGAVRLAGQTFPDRRNAAGDGLKTRLPLLVDNDIQPGYGFFKAPSRGGSRSCFGISVT